MKTKQVLLAMTFLIVSVAASARFFAPGDQVTCTYPDGWGHWTGTATASWTVNDMVEHCLSGGGSATVVRPRTAELTPG